MCVNTNNTIKGSRFTLAFKDRQTLVQVSDHISTTRPCMYYSISLSDLKEDNITFHPWPLEELEDKTYSKGLAHTIGIVPVGSYGYSPFRILLLPV